MSVILPGGCSGLIATPVAAVDYVARWGAVAHWGMAGSSGGTETDVINSLVLGSTNTVGSAAGIIGNARQFNSASSRRLAKTDDATMSTGNIDFWGSDWVYLDSKAANMYIFAKGTTSTTEYGVTYNQTSDRFTAFIRGASGGTVRSAVANTFGSPSLSAWHHIVWYHDAVNDLVGIAVNGGAFDTTATATTAPADQAGQTWIGAEPSAGQYFDGRIDEVTFGKSPALGIAALATEIRDRLFNAGSGRAYPWTS